MVWAQMYPTQSSVRPARVHNAEGRAVESNQVALKALWQCKLVNHNRKTPCWVMLTFACKIEQWGEILTIWHPRTFRPQLVKEGVDHRFHRAEARSWCVLQ